MAYYKEDSLHNSQYLTYSYVTTLYESGDSKGLMAVARRTDEPTAVREDARRALRLLARLGDAAAGSFCVGIARVPESRHHAA